MVSLLLAALCWAFAGPQVLIGIFLLLGVGVGLVSGMLFKIVPFLAWFHLQHRQLTTGRFDVEVPHMLTFLPERSARLQFAFHLLSLAAVIAAWAIPALSAPAAIILALSALVFGRLILNGVLRYRRVASHLRD